MSQDLVLFEAPPDPETFGLPADSRLEVYTEWLPETPEPERTPQPIAVDEQTGRITFADDMLRFGADTRLMRGRAFALQDGGEGGEQVQVGKQFARLDGRPILIESVNHREIKPLLADLPRAAFQKQKSPPATSRAQALALYQSSGAAEQNFAFGAIPNRGVIIDYETKSGPYGTLTLFNGTTYWISGPVDVSSSLTLQAGSIAKFAMNANLRLISGTLTCPTTGQAVLTSRDDDLFGDTNIPGNTHVPTYMASPAIAFYFLSSPQTVRNVRIRWAKTGVHAAGSVPLTHAVADSIIEQTDKGLQNSISGGTLAISNVKQCNVITHNVGSVSGAMSQDCGVANASQYAGAQEEPVIAGNPSNPAQIVIVSMDRQATPVTLLKMRSDDGGVTWPGTLRAQLPPGLDTPRGDSDPDLVWDSWGNLFLTYIDSTSALKLYVSTDSGSSWTNVSGLSGITIDSVPRLAVGPKLGSPQKSSLWISYSTASAAYAAGIEVGGAGTNNIGPGWTGPVLLTNSTGSKFTSVAVGPAGEVAVSHVARGSLGSTSTPVYFALNTTGLGSTVFNNRTSFTIDIGYEGFPPNDGVEMPPIPHLAWDQTQNRLYVAYPDRPPEGSADDTDIYVRYTTDYGVNWVPAVSGKGHKVNTGVTNRTEFHPRIAVDQNSGRVGVIWYDCRNDSSNTRPHIFAAVSTDRFATAEPQNFQVNPAWSELTSGAGRSFKEYIGLAFTKGFLYPAWLDNSNYRQDTPNPNTPPDPPYETNQFEIYSARIPF